MLIITVATNLEEECEIEEQCSQGISNSECTESMCKCKKDYITMNNQCYLTKGNYSRTLIIQIYNLFTHKM